MMERILTYESALAAVLRHAEGLSAPVGIETVDLLQAAGRTLAEPVLADRDQPPFDRSTRDGYAVRAGDIDGPLQLVGSLRAGQTWQGAALEGGQAIEIMTGAPVPAGADAVLMVEHATLDGALLNVEPGRALRSRENIVPRASEAYAGQTVLPRGRRIAAAETAVAASCGCARLEIFERPRVAIIATGDELVELGGLSDEPAPHQIRNSNSYALAALVTAEGGQPQRLPIARDTREDLLARIAQGSVADLMLLSGGVSMGKYDLVEQVLTECGAEFLFTGALIQPGKPVVFGRLPKPAIALTGMSAPITNPGAPRPASEMWAATESRASECTYFFGLPGNPISTQVCFHLFVTPLLRALAGRTELAPRFVEATLAEDVPGGAKVTRFLPAELAGSFARTEVRLAGWQGSGDLAANARGNCYCVLPVGPERFKAGEIVRVLLR